MSLSASCLFLLYCHFYKMREWKVLETIFEPGIYSPLWWGMLALGSSWYFLLEKVDFDDDEDR